MSRPGRPGSTTSASSRPSTRKPPAGTGSAMTPSPPAKTARTRTRRRAAGDRSPGRAGQRRPRLGRPAHRRRPRGGRRRDRRLPHRQGRRPGAHRRRARGRRLAPRRRRSRPRRRRPGPAGGRHRRARRRGRPHHPGGLMIDLKNHYGFTRTPFGKDLAPSMLHRYPAHSEAVARITWCARERALGVITGEAGSGKTAAARAAVTALDQTRHTLVYLPDPTTGTRGIHHHVVTALGGRPAHGSAELAAQAASVIAAEHGERGRLPLLVVDEAHLLGHAQLEAIRLLTNAEMDAASPLACLLIGQPTLRRMLRLGVLAALDQRIGLRYAMPAMTPAQTSDYITHHLKLAGRSDTLFSDDAMALVHDAARGLPRAVNNIATQALVAAMAERKNIV